MSPLRLAIVVGLELDVACSFDLAPKLDLYLKYILVVVLRSRGGRGFPRCHIFHALCPCHAVMNVPKTAKMPKTTSVRVSVGTVWEVAKVTRLELPVTPGYAAIMFVKGVKVMSQMKRMIYLESKPWEERVYICFINFDRRVACGNWKWAKCWIAAFSRGRHW